MFKNLSYKNFLILFAAGVINAIGITMFLAPVNLYDTGFSGTAMLVSQMAGNDWSFSVCLILINIPFFLYGYKKLGGAFTLYSICAVVTYAVSAYVISMLVDVTTTSPFAGSDLLLCAIFGGIISGIGSGLTIRYGGAIDGVEVMAVIFAKKLGLTVGTFVMIYNVILYVIAGCIFQSWILPLYSIITYGAAIKTVDFIVEGLDKVKSAMIVTTKADEISGQLSDIFGHGVTHIDAMGYYSGKEQKIIYFVVNRFQVVKLKNIVTSIDPDAFVTISEVSSAFGKSIGD